MLLMAMLIASLWAILEAIDVVWSLTVDLTFLNPSKLECSIVTKNSFLIFLNSRPLEWDYKQGHF